MEQIKIDFPKSRPIQSRLDRLYRLLELDSNNW